MSRVLNHKDWTNYIYGFKTYEALENKPEGRILQAMKRVERILIGGSDRN